MKRFSRVRVVIAVSRRLGPAPPVVPSVAAADRVLRATADRHLLPSTPDQVRAPAAWQSAACPVPGGSANHRPRSGPTYRSQTLRVARDDERQVGGQGKGESGRGE